MSGPIQTLPAGFLSLLQLKNMGVNPSQLIDSVQPSFDMMEWYLRNAVTLETQCSLNIPATENRSWFPTLGDNVINWNSGDEPQSWVFLDVTIEIVTGSYSGNFQACRMNSITQTGRRMGTGMVTSETPGVMSWQGNSHIIGRHTWWSAPGYIPEVNYSGANGDVMNGWARMVFLR